MNCPLCNAKMANGYASLHGTLRGFLLFGLSREHLWFQNGEKEELVLKSKAGSDAFRCNECGTLVLPDPDRILDIAMKRAHAGDRERARELYQSAINAGIEPDFCRKRIADLK